jgi:hypothetical protein
LLDVVVLRWRRGCDALLELHSSLVCRYRLCFCR